MSKVENPEDDDLLQENIDDELEEDDIEDEDLDESEDDESEDDDEEDDSDPKSKDARAKLNAQNRFLKKEGYEFINGKWVKPTNKKPDTKVEKKSSKTTALSNSDMFVLIKANVPEEDIQEVQDYARMKGVTIKEALSTNFVKTLLSDKAEERATAEAAHTGSSRRTTGKKTTSQVLSDAEKGDLPDDPTVLAQARFAKKKAEKDHRKR
jgi:hypothetical protein